MTRHDPHAYRDHLVLAIDPHPPELRKRISFSHILDKLVNPTFSQAVETRIRWTLS